MVRKKAQSSVYKSLLFKCPHTIQISTHNKELMEHIYSHIPLEIFEYSHVNLHNDQFKCIHKIYSIKH